MNNALKGQNKAKTGLVIGGVVAGASLILLNKNARTKVKDTSKTVKDSVGKYATTIKEDPQGAKDVIITRIQNATQISKDAINKIQTILDTQVRDIKDTSANVADETKSVLSTAKEAKSDLKDVKDQAVDAKDELMSAKDDIEEKNNQKTEITTNHTITKTPVN